VEEDMKQNKVFFLLICIFLSLTFISAGISDCTIYGNCAPVANPQDLINRINYTEVNVNNSIYWQGHTGTDGSWLTNILYNYNHTTIANAYTLATNNSLATWILSLGYINSIDYTKIVLNNQSNTINGNLTVKNLTADYIYSQPLTGMLGSGIIWVNGTNQFAEIQLDCGGDLKCNYSAFKVRLINTTNDVKYCDIPAGSVTATDNAHNVFYIDNSCAIQKTTIQTYIQTPISPGGIADFGNVIYEGSNSYNSNGIGLENKRIIKLRKLLLQSTGKHLSIINGGFSLQQNTNFDFNITAGQYIYLMDVVSTTFKQASVNKNEVLYHTGAGTWAGEDQSALNVSTCDTGTGIAACSNPTRYRRSFIFMIGYNETTDATQIHQLLPLQSMSYTTIAACLDINTNPITYTLPTFYQYGAVPLYAYCAKATDTTWSAAQLIDLRGSSGGGGSGGQTDTSTLVPYTGAIANVDLGNNNLTANKINTTIIKFTVPTMNITYNSSGCILICGVTSCSAQC
jgi:hypothetical protein